MFGLGSKKKTKSLMFGLGSEPAENLEVKKKSKKFEKWLLKSILGVTIFYLLYWNYYLNDLDLYIPLDNFAYVFIFTFLSRWGSVLMVSLIFMEFDVSLKFARILKASFDYLMSSIIFAFGLSEVVRKYLENVYFLIFIYLFVRVVIFLVSDFLSKTISISLTFTLFTILSFISMGVYFSYSIIYIE